MTIQMTPIIGGNDYCAAYIGPVISAESEITHPLARLRGTPVDRTSPIYARIEVSADTPMIIGSVTDSSNGFPAACGVTVTVQDPSGTYISSVRPSATNPNFVKFFNDRDEGGGDSVYAFAIMRPETGAWEGTWTLAVTYTAPSGEGDAYIYFSTMPTADAYNTIVEAIKPHVEQSSQPGATYGCDICEMACYTVAVVVSLALLTVGFVLSTASAPIASMVLLLGVLPTTALLMLQVLVAAIPIGVTAMSLNLCSWVGACTPITGIRVTKPFPGAAVRGVANVQAEAFGADEVRFYCGGEPATDWFGSTDQYFGSLWDTDSVANGDQALYAVGRTGSVTAWSAGSVVSVQNPTL